MKGSADPGGSLGAGNGHLWAAASGMRAGLARLTAGAGRKRARQDGTAAGGARQRRGTGFRCQALALVLLGGEALEAANAPAAAAEPAIELPPMIVAESSKAPPWLYVNAGNTEYLSRCSAALTRAFVTAQQDFDQRLRGLIPEAFWPKMDTPSASILAPIQLKQAADDAVIQEMIRVEEEASRQKADQARRDQRMPMAAARFQFLPNLRLDDRDMSAVLTYLDERDFDGEHLIAAHEHVHYRLLRRTPMLPSWLVEGIVSIYQDADFRVRPITLRPLRWHSPEESSALLRDPEGRRVLLPAQELFAPDVFLSEADRHPERIAAWRAQVALFFRWALDPRHALPRDALWKFAGKAGEEAVTEESFIACFGFGYSDLRDRLSDYLPAAVKDAVHLDPGERPRRVAFEVRPATPAQIARLRGEWERLEIPYVRAKHPQFVERYVEQARFTLQRAYDRGDRDPRLVAARGLAELDAGNPNDARVLLEQAAAGGVGRPRVYYELARLRWTALTEGGSEMRPLDEEKIRGVVEPLRIALDLSPPLPEAFMLLADAWLRCPSPPPPADTATITRGARLFVGIPALGFRVALLQVRQGQRGAAANTLAMAKPFVMDPKLRARFDQLQASISPPAIP